MLFRYKVLYLFITLSFLLLFQNVFGYEYRELNDRDYRKKYYAECFPQKNLPPEFKTDEEKQEFFKDKLIPRNCTPLGELYEKLYKQTQNDRHIKLAIRSYKEGCKNKTYLSCMRLGDIYSDYDDIQNIPLAKRYLQLACNNGIEESCLSLRRKKTSQLLLWASLGLIGIVIFFMTSTIFQEQIEYEVTEQLEDPSAKKEVNKHGSILRYSRPFFKRYISPVVGTMKFQKKIKEKYKQPLASAGLTDYLSPEDFYAFKLFLILAFPILFLLIRTFLEESWPLSYIPIIAVGGYFYPNIWIQGKIKNRQKEVIIFMPFAVDMLALSVEAGLDFMAAISKVVEKAKDSALNDEFKIMMKEIKVGANRSEALRNLAWRINLMQVTSFCATLIAADSVGASIGPILKSLSSDIRQKKSAEIEKAGAQAATKILLPMMMFILPAVLLIVAAPLVLKFIAGD